jgi:hypothetical protein
LQTNRTGLEGIRRDGTGRDEGAAKSVQEGTKRDQKGPDGTKTTELQNWGLQVRVLCLPHHAKSIT